VNPPNFTSHFKLSDGAESSLLNDITAVVVTFNSAHCVASLVKTLRSFPHIVIVDNASSDGCIAALKTQLPQARIFQNNHNLGFGAANNIGLSLSSSIYTLLLNPDCSLDVEAIALLKTWLQKGASVAVPQLLNPTGIAWSPEANYRPSEFSWRTRASFAEGALCVEFACAACWLAHTSALRSVGGFDDRFFLYYEDDDLCIRLRRTNHEIVVEPSAQAQHISGGSTTPSLKSLWARSLHMARSKVLLSALHQGARAAFMRRLGLLAEGLLGVLLKPFALDGRGMVRSAGRFMGAFTAPWFSKNHTPKNIL